MDSTPVLLATLGQRPEAITMALDVLLPRYSYEEIVILHTDAERSGIASAYTKLMQRLQTDYDVRVRSQELRFASGLPLIDISDQSSAEAYYQALVEVLSYYRTTYIPIHLLVAGGRKAMSIYAALAAGLIFGEYDRVWTIHTPSELMQSGMFHVSPGQQDRIQMIQLPVHASRLLPGSIAGQPVERLIERSRTSPRQLFMTALTAEEFRLTEILQQHPYAGNEALGELLAKSPKTIEHQFGSIYQKLFTYFDLDIHDKRKRQVLLDVLVGRV